MARSGGREECDGDGSLVLFAGVMTMWTNRTHRHGLTSNEPNYGSDNSLPIL